MVLIIAVLLGIAVVTFLGTSHAAQNRAAQSTSRQALGTAKVLFGAAEDYTAATVSALEGAEPELAFVPGADSSDGPDVVSVDAPDEGTFIIAVYSQTGTCFFLRDEAVPTGRGTTYAARSSDGTDCAAATPPSTFSERW